MVEKDSSSPVTRFEKIKTFRQSCPWLHHLQKQERLQKTRMVYPKMKPCKTMCTVVYVRPCTKQNENKITGCKELIKNNSSNKEKPPHPIPYSLHPPHHHHSSPTHTYTLCREDFLVWKRSSQEEEMEEQLPPEQETRKKMNRDCMERSTR